MLIPFTIPYIWASFVMLASLFRFTVASLITPPPFPQSTPPPSPSSSAPNVGTTTSCFKMSLDPNAIPMWSQCGGASYDGPGICSAGGECIFVNEHYSSCQPIGQAVVLCK